MITTVADILNPSIERNFLRRQSIPEEDEVRDFTEDELKLEEEGANRASKIGNGRPINVDPNAWVICITPINTRIININKNSKSFIHLLKKMANTYYIVSSFLKISSLLVGIKNLHSISQQYY